MLSHQLNWLKKENEKEVSKETSQNRLLESPKLNITQLSRNLQPSELCHCWYVRWVIAMHHRQVGLKLLQSKLSFLILKDYNAQVIKC